MYEAVKFLHIITAVTSIGLFVLRGYFIYLARRPIQGRFMRIFPHVNDAVLLGFGVTLVVITGISPLVQAWLGLKLVLLVFYILLGMNAMRWQQGSRAGVISWLLAIGVFAYMLCLATKKYICLGI